MDAILMVEKALMDAEDHPTRTALWRSLHHRIQYHAFRRVLDYLEASGKISLHGSQQPKLQALIEPSLGVM